MPEIPAVKVPHREWDFYTREEAEALFAAATDPRECALLVFAVHTGARWSEQRVAQWGDVDWHRGQISIRRSMPHNTTAVGSTRSGRERHVPM